jgi:hypothetical protein
MFFVNFKTNSCLLPDTLNHALELFDALPPKELKLAQAQAKETLKMYIEAANSALEILRLLNQDKREEKVESSD